jgi:hypothetical protein
MPVYLKSDRFANPLTSKADRFTERFQKTTETADIQQTVEAQEKKVKTQSKSERFEEAGSNKALIIVAIAAVSGYFLLKKKKS